MCRPGREGIVWLQRDVTRTRRTTVNHSDARVVPPHAGRGALGGRTTSVASRDGWAGATNDLTVNHETLGRTGGTSPFRSVEPWGEVLPAWPLVTASTLLLQRGRAGLPTI